MNRLSLVVMIAPEDHRSKNREGSSARTCLARTHTLSNIALRLYRRH